MFFLNRLISSFYNYKNNSAFCIENKHYSYNVLLSKILSIQKIIDNEHSTVQRVGIIIANDIETYASILAVLLSGKTYVPINADYPIQRIEKIIELAEIKVILSGSTNFTNKIPVINTASLELKSYDIQIKHPVFQNSDSYAYILFTSGSTGTPKGVPISYKNLDSFAQAFYSLGYQLDESDRFLQMFDLTFDLSIMSYLIPLTMGACVYTIPVNGTKYMNVYRILEECKITFALMVPSILTSLRSYFSEIELPYLRYSLFCGEALYKDIVIEWMRCAANAVVENVYGPTEATIFCLTYRIERNEDIDEYNGITTIGNEMPDMEAIIVDEHCELLGTGSVGELCLSGGQLTSGYLDDEKNKTAFFNYKGKIFYRTGDIAFKNDNGNFMYSGRLDNQVKIQGFRVELSEIEHHFRKVTGNNNIVAVVISRMNGLNQIEIIIEGEKIDTDTLTASIRKKLPQYMMPAQIHFVNPFPLNINGKIDRTKLLQTVAAIS